MPGTRAFWRKTVVRLLTGNRVGHIGYPLQVIWHILSVWYLYIFGSMGKARRWNEIIHV